MLNFGKIDQYIFLGGGQLLSEFALKLSLAQEKVLVVTAARHAVEMVVDPLGQEVSLEEFLKRHHIECIKTDNIYAPEVIKRITPTSLGISLSAAWIFKQDFIDFFKGKLVNLHPTRLPQDRGGGGHSWRILRDERLGFVQIHLVSTGVDTGDIIRFAEFFYPQGCRLPQDYFALTHQKDIELLDIFLKDVKAQKTFETYKQQKYFGTYWPRLATDAHGFIDWSWTLREIELFICAFDDPYRGASTFVHGTQKVRIKKCQSTVDDGIFHPFQQGLVYKISGQALFVATKEGGLIVHQLTDADGNDIKQQIKTGDRFFTPRSYLEEAKMYRAFYTPEGLKSK